MSNELKGGSNILRLNPPNYDTLNSVGGSLLK